MDNVVERLPVEPTAPLPSRDSVAPPESARVDIRSAMLTGIFVMLVFYTLYFAAPVLMPIILALLFNFFHAGFCLRLWRNFMIYNHILRYGICVESNIGKLFRFNTLGCDQQGDEKSQPHSNERTGFAPGW